jgi:HEAT repeat protein
MYFKIAVTLVALTVPQQDTKQPSRFAEELKAIQTGTPAERESALKAIRRSDSDDNAKPDQRAIAVIEPLLGSDDKELRRLAIRALLSVRAEATVFSPLLVDADLDIRVAAVRAYFDAGGQLPKVRFILRDNEAKVRRAAAWHYLENRGEPGEVVSLLDDPDERVAGIVIQLLVRFGGDAKHFRTALQSNHSSVRRPAALALLARRKISLSDLLPHLKDDIDNDLHSLLASIDEVDRPQVVPILKQWLDDDDRWVPGFAKSTLNDWGIATVTLEEVHKALSHPDFDVRVEMIRTIRGQPFEVAQFLPEIQAGLAAEEGVTLWSESLHLARERKLTGLVPVLRPFMLKQHPDDPQGTFQSWTARVIAELVPEENEPLDVMGRMLNSQDKTVRIEVTKELFRMKLPPDRIAYMAKWLMATVVEPDTSTPGMYSRWILANGGKAIVPTVTKWLSDDTDLKLQSAVLDVAGGLFELEAKTQEQHSLNATLTKELTPHFIRLLDSKVPEIRMKAMRLLIGVRAEIDKGNYDWSPILAEYVETAANSPVPEVRHLATGLLGFFETNPPAARVRLVKQLSEDPTIQVRAGAAFAALCLPDANQTAIAQSLIDMLNDGDKDMRRKICNALKDNDVDLRFALPQLFKLLETKDMTAVPELLGAIGKPAIPGLLERLADPRPYVRNRSAEALGQIGDPDFSQSLVPLLSDSDSRTAALEALLQLESTSPELTGSLMTIVKSELDETFSRSFNPAIRLLGRIGPPASPAIAMLARQKYELTEDYTDGGADVIPTEAPLMAVALAKIEPTKGIGLMGFRKILTGVSNGRSWLYDDGDRGAPSGFEAAIDAIVELNERCYPLIPKLTEIAEPPGQLIHPGYRSLAAYALSKLEPSKAAYWRKQGKTLRDRLPERDYARQPIDQRFGFKLK